MQGQYNEPFFQFDLKRMYNITVKHCIFFIKEMSCQIDLIPLWSISRMVTITFIPSAAIGADGYCRRSLRPAVCPSVRLSVIPSVSLSGCLSRTTLSLWLFKDFNYQPKIWWDGAQYPETDRCIRWLCSATFCVFHGTLKFSMIWFLPGLREDLITLPRLKISDASLKCCGVMHSNMKQIAI